MKKTHHKKRNVRSASKKKVPGRKLPKLEMYAVLGLETNKRILEKLESVEESIGILARQKKRELDEETSPETSDE